MYVPPAFREDRPDVLHALMAGHPLATLVTVGADGLRHVRKSIRRKASRHVAANLPDQRRAGGCGRRP